MNQNNLEDKIKKFKLKDEQLTSNQFGKTNSSSEKMTTKALMVGIDLVAGVLVGVIIGTFFDKLFTTKPIFLIICILLGIITSFRNIWLKLKNDSANDPS